MSEKTQIEAGPELDARIMRLVGMPSGGWCPSTDWRDAMIAAERFGLFEYRGDRFYLTHAQGQWYVSGMFHGCPNSVYDPSGPMAICRAIIALRPGGPVRCPQA